MERTLVKPTGDGSAAEPLRAGSAMGSAAVSTTEVVVQAGAGVPQPMRRGRFNESVPGGTEGSVVAAILKNRFLSAIGPEDLAALLPRMREVTLRKGQVLIEQEAEVEEVHFPLSAQLCNLTVFTDGKSVETAVVGAEGMSGLAPFMADAPCAWQVVVQVPGTALALPASVLRFQAGQSADLRHLLTRLVHDYQAQSAQTAACNTVHRSTAKLARWLLMFDDRSQGARLDITQQDLAALMGMQRTTINSAAGELKAMGAIGYRRAAIRILDRQTLERASCECYETQRQRSRALGLDPA